ncbi:MAG: hypothetical protein ACLUPF_06095 [Dorea sp.]
MQTHMTGGLLLWKDMHFAMKVKSGKMNDYRKKLGEIWPDLTTFLDRNKVKISVSGMQKT